MSSPATPRHNLFVLLPETARRNMLGCLNCADLVRLDSAMMNHEGRNALIGAYKEMEVYGYVFPYSLPIYRYDTVLKNTEELCRGLEWTEERGIIAREYTLDIKDCDHHNHLFALITHERKAMARMLLTRCNKSYDANQPHPSHNPLRYASGCGMVELVRLLCQRQDIEVDLTDERTQTALHKAAYAGHLECVQTLIDIGKAKINLSRDDGNTPLHRAAMNNHFEVVKFLVSRGADIHAVGSWGETVVEKAHNFREVVEYLESQHTLSKAQAEVF